MTEKNQNMSACNHCPLKQDTAKTKICISSMHLFLYIPLHSSIFLYIPLHMHFLYIQDTAKTTMSHNLTFLCIHVEFANLCIYASIYESIPLYMHFLYTQDTAKNTMSQNLNFLCIHVEFANFKSLIMQASFPPIPLSLSLYT